MNKAKFRDLYKRIWRGDYNNIDFQDACDFVLELGFELARQRGSHMIFKMPGIPDIINLQDNKGKVKAYQMREIREVIKKYRMGGEENER